MKSELRLEEILLLQEAKSATVLDWINKFDSGTLTKEDFQKHWGNWVPKAFTSESGLDSCEPIVKDHILSSILVETLEGFIFHGKEDYQNSIFESHNISSICGYIFKAGDPFFSCLECGTDSTCVLCTSCFKNSAHKNHKYKIGTSGGGGCCDCGDVLSWKSNPHCKEHLKGAQNVSSYSIPEDVVIRTAHVVGAVLQYCFEMLTLDPSSAIPAILKGNEEIESKMTLEERYCVLLYNDEIHSFEQVANALAKVTKCSSVEAFSLATFVDKEGRAILRHSSYLNCHELVKELDAFTSLHNTQPLKVYIINWYLIVHQMFSLHLLLWLERFMKQTKEFRDTLTSVGLNLCNHTKVSWLLQGLQRSLVEGVFLYDSRLWKSAKVYWCRLFLSIMLVDHENKIAFAKIFANYYGIVIKNFIRDDHDHVFSVASLSVQMFTVPSIAHHLIASENVLSTLFNTFHSECTKVCGAFGKLEFNHTSSYFQFFRSFCVLTDLRYILTSPPEEWTHDLRKNFLNGVSVFLKVLLLIQDMSSTIRQIEQHMEYEPEWRYEFKLQMKLSPIITAIITWCSTDQIVALKAFKLTSRKLFEYISPGMKEENFTNVPLIGFDVKCLKYDVSSQPISVHLPLSRFLAGLYLNLQKFGFNYNSPELNALIKPTPLKLIEPVLRIKIMIAQVSAGMWKRNGLSLLNQIHLYRCCRSEMLDKDIILLQIGASLIESNEFLINILYKFNLLHWLRPEFESQLESLDDDSVKQIITISEEFLSLIITIIGERFQPNVGEVCPEECFQYEILHRLFIKPSSHSELLANITDIDSSKIDLESIINKIATFQKPNSSQKGVYIAKEDFRNKYNVFFYHYTKEERSKAEEAQKEERKYKDDKRYINCCPPPQLPKFTEHFKSVACLLHSSVLLHIIHTILSRIINPHSKCVSENQFHMILYLIGFALQEEECTCQVNFITEANKWNLESLLESCLDSQLVEIHKELGGWVLDKYRSYLVDPASNKTDIKSKISEPSHELDGKNISSSQSKLAAERQAAIMAQMALLQQNFLKKHSNAFENICNDSEETDDNSLNEKEGKILKCILCQENQAVSYNGPAMVSAAFVQKSNVLAKTMTQWYEVLGLNIHPPLHVNTCGHFMHVKCWKEYVQVAYSMRERRPYRLIQAAAFDGEKGEYLCPLCKCLSNTVLPLLPETTYRESKMQFSEWLQFLVKNSMDFDFSQLDKHHVKMFCDTCILLSLNNADLGESQSEITSRQKSTSCPLHNVSSEIPEREKQSPPSVDPSLPAEAGASNVPHKSDFCSDEIITVIDLFISNLANISENSVFVNENFLLVYHSCAYTLRTLVKYLQFSNQPLLGAFTYRQDSCIRNLVNLSSLLSNINKDKLINIDLSQKKLFFLLNTCESGWPNILKWDCFELYIFFVMTMPSAPDYAMLQEDDKNVLIFILLLNFAQIIISTDMSDLISLESDITSDDTKCIATIIKLFKICSGVNTIEVWNLLKNLSLPLLRCSAILYYFKTGYQPNQPLTEIGGDTYENIMDFLGIPSGCKELLDSPPVNDIFVKWALNPRVSITHNEMSSPNAVLRKLIDLPQDYCELLNSASTFTCSNSHREDVRNPTLCLVCGEFICAEVYCCQKELNKVVVGSCTFHTHWCGAGTGLFLRIKECQVLLLSSNPSRGCFIPSPYFDEYGESDPGLHRGNPLYLCEDEYSKLQKLWLSHRIQEEISRSIESLQGFTSTQWSLL